MGRGHLKVIEQVPVSFVRRGGDWSQEGGNNTLIVMGTDRALPDGPATLDDGLGTVESESGNGKGTGTVMIVAGRKDLEGGNPDINSDDTTLYMSQKTDADLNMGLDQIPASYPDGVEPVNFTGPSSIVKADAVRTVFRDSYKLAPEDASSYVHFDNDLLQVKFKDNVFMTVQENNVTIDVNRGKNIIQINDDGTINITSESQVNVKTRTLHVEAQDTIEMSTGQFTLEARSSAKITTPTMTVTTPAGVGKTVMSDAGIDVTPKAQVNGPATVSGPLSAAGGTMKMGPGSMTVQGTANFTGDVKSGAISLQTHKHNIMQIKIGPDSIPTLVPF